MEGDGGSFRHAVGFPNKDFNYDLPNTKQECYFPNLRLMLSIRYKYYSIFEAASLNIHVGLLRNIGL